MTVLAGIISGIILCSIAFIYLMRNFMVVSYKFEGTFSQVNKAIEEIIPSFEGWSFPIEYWEFHKSQLSKNLTYDNIKNMVMHFVCKPQHANTVLKVEPNMGAIMPCTWAVYETSAKEVYIAKMNIALMSKMYFGTIRRVMADVASTEEKMLAQIKERIKQYKNAEN